MREKSSTEILISALHQNIRRQCLYLCIFSHVCATGSQTKHHRLHSFFFMKVYMNTTRRNLINWGSTFMVKAKLIASWSLLYWRKNLISMYFLCPLKLTQMEESENQTMRYFNKYFQGFVTVFRTLISDTCPSNSHIYLGIFSLSQIKLVWQCGSRANLLFKFEYANVLKL